MAYHFSKIVHVWLTETNTDEKKLWGGTCVIQYKAYFPKLSSLSWAKTLLGPHKDRSTRAHNTHPHLPSSFFQDLMRALARVWTSSSELCFLTAFTDIPTLVDYTQTDREREKQGGPVMKNWCPSSPILSGTLVATVQIIYNMLNLSWFFWTLWFLALTDTDHRHSSTAAQRSACSCLPCAEKLFSLTCRHKDTQTWNIKDEAETKLIL